MLGLRRLASITFDQPLAQAAATKPAADDRWLFPARTPMMAWPRRQRSRRHSPPLARWSSARDTCSRASAVRAAPPPQATHGRGADPDPCARRPRPQLLAERAVQRPGGRGAAVQLHVRAAAAAPQRHRAQGQEPCGPAQPALRPAELGQGGGPAEGPAGEQGPADRRARRQGGAAEGRCCALCQRQARAKRCRGRPWL